MKRKLYIDDERYPKTDGWDIVSSYEEFENWINENGLPDEVSFDHDLGPNQPTGYDCAKEMMNMCYRRGWLKLPKWNVHSANPVGRDNIISMLKHYEKMQKLENH